MPNLQQMLIGAGAAGEKYWLNGWYYNATSYSIDWKQIDVDDAGNIYTFGPGWANGKFGWFAKWNKDGEKVYMRKINAKQGDDIAHGMAVSGTKAYLAGHQGYSTTYPGAPMMALNLSDGTIAWQKRYTTDNTNENRNHTKAVAADSSGNAYWVTKRLSYTDDFIVYKTNSSGVLQWAARITRPSGSQYIDQMNRIKLDSSGNVYVSGNRQTNGSNTYNGFLIKLNSSGVLQWTRQLGQSSSGNQRFYDIAIDSSSNVYCVGTDRDTYHRGWIVKYNSSGTVQWQTNYGGNTNQSVNQYQWNCAFHDGYLYTGGENDITGQNSHLIKIDPSDGSIEWQRYIKAWTNAASGASYFWWKKCKMRIANDSIYIGGLQSYDSSKYAGIVVKLPLTALDDDIGSGDKTWPVGTWTHPMNATTHTETSPSFTGTLLSSGSCEDGTGEVWEVTSASSTLFVQHELHEIDV